MSKKLIIGLVVLFVLVLSLSPVSAGLCLGNDGYYHDCGDNKYFEDRDYNGYYYYHGRYYPTRDYYREYYRPRGYKKNYCCKDERLSYKDTEDYTRIIVYDYEDRWINEKLKYTINEKTEYELDYDKPYYRSRYDSIKYMNDRYYGNKYHKGEGSWSDFWYDDYLIPGTYYYKK